MFIRCLQYVSLIVLSIPVLSVTFRITRLPADSLVILVLCSLLLMSISLLIKLKVSIFEKLEALPHYFLTVFFLGLLWRFAGETSHFLLAIYLACIHAFIFHWIFTNGFPMKIKLWRARNHLEKGAVVGWAILQTFSFPLLFTWLWYFVLFPSSSDKQHMESFAFYVGMPMTFVSIVFAVIYMGVQTHIARNNRARQ
jgi:hypothetical protein